MFTSVKQSVYLEKLIRLLYLMYDQIPTHRNDSYLFKRYRQIYIKKKHLIMRSI